MDSNCATYDGFGQVLVASNVSEHASAFRKGQAVYIRSGISALLIGERLVRVICAMRPRMACCNFCDPT